MQYTLKVKPHSCHSEITCFKSWDTNAATVIPRLGHVQWLIYAQILDVDCHFRLWRVMLELLMSLNAVVKSQFDSISLLKTSQDIALKGQTSYLFSPRRSMNDKQKWIWNMSGNRTKNQPSSKGVWLTKPAAELVLVPNKARWHASAVQC